MLANSAEAAIFQHSKSRRWAVNSQKGDNAATRSQQQRTHCHLCSAYEALVGAQQRRAREPTSKFHGAVQARPQQLRRHSSHALRRCPVFIDFDASELSPRQSSWAALHTSDSLPRGSAFQWRSVYSSKGFIGDSVLWGAFVLLDTRGQLWTFVARGLGSDIFAPSQRAA